MTLSPEQVAKGLTSAVALAGLGITCYKKGIVPAYRWCIALHASFTGLIESVAGIQRELKTNGGSSMRDVVERTSTAVGQMRSTLSMTIALQRTMAANTRTPMYQTTADGSYAWVNETWSRVTGIPLGEALGLGWVNGIHEQDRDRVIREWEHATDDERAFRCEFRYQHINTGAVLRVKVEAQPFRCDDGDIAGWTGTAYPIDGNGEVVVYERRDQASPMRAVV